MKQAPPEEDVKPSKPPLLILQHRRLHHVTSLCVRNMTFSLSSVHDTDSPSINDPLLYFTLHVNSRDDQGEIFKSDTVRYSPNPTWSSFALDNPKYFNLTGFTIRLWIGTDDNFMPALTWQVALKSLACVGSKLNSDKVAFHSNAIVFGLDGLYYGHSTSVTLLQPISSLLPTIDSNDVKKSYSLFSLRRIISCKSATLQCKRNVVSIREEVKNYVNTKKEVFQLEVELENLRSRIKHLRRLNCRECALLSCEKQDAASSNLVIKRKEEELKEQEVELKEEQSNYRETHKSHLTSRVQLQQLMKQLGLRRRDILSELSLIFPISKAHLPPTSKSHKKSSPSNDEVFTICNVPLPDSESLNSKDDLRTSAALGFTAQLLTMLSHFTLVPQRYPITSKNSLPCVIDEVTEKLSDRERVFPFVVKSSKERFLFLYGVFLLNKNITQLRYFFNIGTADLRPTLENIKSLLEERLGAKAMIGHHSQPIDITNAPAHRTRPVSSTSNSELLVPSSSQARPYEPLLGTVKTIPPDSTASPSHKFAQRMENRHTELLSLRGELLGGKESVRPRDRSPAFRADSMPPLDLESQTSSTSDASSYRSNMQDDSVESTTSNMKTQRHLTGLEEIGETKQAKQKTKVPLANARAELFGKKSSQRSVDSGRWSRRTTSASSDSLREKRSALFNRRDRRTEHSDSMSSSATDSSRSKANTISSNTSETGSNKFNPENDDVIISDNNKVVNGEVHELAVSRPNTDSFTNGSSKLEVDLPLASNQNVFMVDSEGHAPVIYQSDEELDLC